MITVKEDSDPSSPYNSKDVFLKLKISGEVLYKVNSQGASEEEISDWKEELMHELDSKIADVILGNPDIGELEELISLEINEI